jgi:hypothetical protein
LLVLVECCYRPFIEYQLEADLKSLVDNGFLLKLLPSMFTEDQWDTMRDLDMTVTVVFCFTSKLLQRLISTRIVQRELEYLMRIRKKAIIKCRWVRIRNYWISLRNARQELEQNGYAVEYVHFVVIRLLTR